MAQFDPGDCAFNPNVLNTQNQQMLGHGLIFYPGCTVANNSGLILKTVEKVGPGVSGVYNKYHKRMHVDYFNVQVFAS